MFKISFILFDILPKINFYAKNNSQYLKILLEQKSRIELMCYLTNWAKNDPEKMFCKFSLE